MKLSGLGKPYLRGTMWWIEYWHRSQRFRESSHSTNEKDAWKLLKRRWKEIGRGHPVGPQLERTTFDDLMDGIRADYLAHTSRFAMRNGMDPTMIVEPEPSSMSKTRGMGDIIHQTL